MRYFASEPPAEIFKRGLHLLLKLCENLFKQKMPPGQSERLHQVIVKYTRGSTKFITPASIVAEITNHHILSLLLYTCPDNDKQHYLVSRWRVQKTFNPLNPEIKT